MTSTITTVSILGFILYNAAVFYLLLDIKVKRPGKRPGKREALFALVILLIVLCSIYFYFASGFEKYADYFPLIVQIPLFAAFSRMSEYKGLKLIFVFLTVLVCSSPVLLLARTVSSLFGYSALSTGLTKILLYIPLLFIIRRFFKPHLKFMLDNCQTGWALFCAVPFLAFTSIYINGQYRYVYDVGIWRETAVWRYCISSMAFLTYALIFRYFRQTKEQMEAKAVLELLQIQLEGTVKYISSLKNSQQQAEIYNHDLRHHLQLINAYALRQDHQAIRGYVGNLVNNVNASAPLSFCKNDALNLVLTAFRSKADLEGVTLSAQVNLAENTPIPEMDLCIILSNALENAIKAAREVTGGTREINLSCHMKNDQLFLEITNPYEGGIDFIDGFPRSDSKRGGLGTKSIALLVEKYSGLYRFEAINGSFALNIILPFAAL